MRGPVGPAVGEVVAVAVRVVIGNNKGGVGKSTLTVRLAEALALLGRRVLVVDLDPQGNTSRRLGWEAQRVGEGGRAVQNLTISEAIRADQVGVAAQCVQEIGWEEEWAEQIDLCPASFELENRLAEAGVVGAHRRLVKALEGADFGAAQVRPHASVPETAELREGRRRDGRHANAVGAPVPGLPGHRGHRGPWSRSWTGPDRS